MFSIVQNISAALRPASNDHSYDRRDHQGEGRSATGDRSDRERLYETHETGSVMRVRSLLLFLEDYLENRLLPRQTAIPEDISPQNRMPKSWRGPDAANMNKEKRDAHYAAKLYAHVSQTASVQSLAQTEMVRSLSEELREVYALIRNLRELEAKGVGYLRVPHDIPFLRGIRYAIDVFNAAHR